MTRRISLGRVELEACLRGTCGLDADPDGAWLPRRSTARQLAGLVDDPRRQVRARCPAGVYVDVEADADRFEAELCIGTRVRDVVAVDVRIGDDPPHRESANAGCWRLRLRLDLPRTGTQRIRLWLSPYAELRIVDLTLDGVRSWRPAPRPAERMLAFGDSITQGMDCPGPSATWPVLVAQALGLECLNQGLGGHRFAPDWVDAQACAAPKLITVAYGTNDWACGDGTAAVRARATAMLARIRAAWPTARVLVIGPIVRFARPEPPPAASLAAIGDAIGDAAAVHGCAFLSGPDVIPADPTLLVDGIHPGEHGARLYADAVLRHLAPGTMP